MNAKSTIKKTSKSWTRREFLSALVASGINAAAGLIFFRYFQKKEPETETFIASVPEYKRELKQIILAGLQELNITSAWVDRRHQRKEHRSQGRRHRIGAEGFSAC